MDVEYQDRWLILDDWDIEKRRDRLTEYCQRHARENKKCWIDWNVDWSIKEFTIQFRTNSRHQPNSQKTW